MNKVILIGRLTRDPDVRWTQGQDQKCVARWTVAVDRKFKKDGEQSADFISCIAFGKVGEFVEKYIHKGIKVVIEGRWQTGSYTNKDGAKVYTNDCFVESIEFGESKKDSESTHAPAPVPDENGFVNIPEGIDEEIPFN